MEYLHCPICGEENNEIKPCARKTDHHLLSYTFRCPGCGMRAFIPEILYEKLVNEDKILVD